ncbi:hypothetical protein B0H11DRAFT_951591 [Mycena galericulata]|nr:hypothetical protein B0H11DRAFT_951591 [Mycena galericulata]
MKPVSSAPRPLTFAFLISQVSLIPIIRSIHVQFRVGSLGQHVVELANLLRSSHSAYGQSFILFNQPYRHPSHLVDALRSFLSISGSGTIRSWV